MADQNRLLVASVEGPKGKADVYEVTEAGVTTVTSGSLSTVYEVVCGGEKQTVLTLGEASIVAHEYAGV